MKPTINLYKPTGMTPLEAIEKFKLLNPSFKKEKMSYAGRLDPMAEGVIVILVGEENKKMKQYMGFDKEYKAEILFGFSSDSNDVLGIAQPGNPSETNPPKINSSEINIKELKKKIKELKGSYNQKIPSYSSYRIKGKPMFHYARKNQEIPEVRKTVFIKSIKINADYEISSNRLLKYIINKINKVKGDFRQEETIQNWNNLLKDENKFLVMDITLTCSSGTYIRAIADDIGKDYGGGLLLSLKRTKVGKFTINKSLKLKN